MVSVYGNTENKVQVSNNKAKYYSDLAGSYATQAGTSATLAGNYEDMCEAWYGSVTTAGTSATSAISSATNDGLGSITTATTSGTGSISSATTDGITSVQAQGTSSVGSVSSAGTSAVGSVSSATTSAIGSISTATTSGITSVNVAGTSVISSATAQATVATQQAALAKQYAEETHGQSDVMVENVRAIPAYTNYTYNQTETKGLADLKAWNRSTFDLSKYTVVGSPTITDDGIASGFSSSNYVTIPSITWGNTFEIYFGKFRLNSIRWQALLSTVSVKSIFIRLTDTYIGLFLSSDGTNFDIANANLSYKVLPANTDIALKLVFTGTQYILSYSVDGGANWVQANVVDSTLKLYNASYNFSSPDLPLDGSMDLKQFSVRVDGREAFNGNKTGVDTITSTLSIPYNQSKTGVKIVDSYYRDRVQSMYSQFGWANYYTLSDTNFTVPQGENLDGHVAVVDWYKNGTTSWEYDTNLDCVETGSCTSGTAVTLPKAFADTNYSLSVPYSAKSATGFTPSATGEYIAKGKVVLG